MTKIQENILKIQEQINFFASLTERDPNSVTLLAVSKTKPISDIVEAYNFGQRKFGESYIKESVEKIKYFKEHGFNDIEWHFIGPIQSNKTKLISENFDVVQSVDREKIALRLNEQRPIGIPPLKVLIQVNISNEKQKSGVHISDLPNLINCILNCKNLQLKGFMGIAEDTTDQKIIEEQFLLINNLYQKYKKSIESIDTLSIGMTGDMQLAIKCQSTMVRIGTAIFGHRIYNV